MAVGLCIPPKIVQTFKDALTSGKIDPSKLSDMTSEERHAFFSDIVGKDHATTTNSLFESKLLLKNQKQGMISWASKVAGLKPSVKQDLISKISRLDRVLDPEDKKAFLHDLASTKLGVSVTQTEAKNIADLSKTLAESKSVSDKLVEQHGFTRASQDARIKAGVDRVMLEKYVTELKASANKKTLGQSIKPSNWISASKSLMGATKGIVASMTSHAPLKHGFMALFENPKNWAKNYMTQFSDAAKEVGGKDMMSVIRAEGYARENSINGIYNKWIPGELSKVNEELHTDIPSKIPGLGRLYKGSKTMFDGFNLKMRMDLVDHYVNIVKKMGLDPNDSEVAKAWGKLAIDQTGGKTKNPDNALGFFLFSQRLLKSQTNNLTMHMFDETATTATRVQSAKTLAKAVMGVGAVMATANALSPGTIEFDPRSSNFGKIKVGDTKFDIAGGYGSIIALGARIASAMQGKPAIKSASIGALSMMGNGIGQTSYGTLIGDFLTGRGSPTEQIISDMANQKTFSGGKPTLKSEVGSLITPIPVQTYFQLKNDKNAANSVLVMMAQQLGLMSNTYGATTSWDSASSKTLTQFKDKVGGTQFTAAAQQYDSRYTSWLNKIKSNDTYNNMSPADQQSLITAEKSKIQSDIFKQNGFKYHAVKTNKSQRNSLLQ